VKIFPRNIAIGLVVVLPFLALYVVIDWMVDALRSFGGPLIRALWSGSADAPALLVTATAVAFAVAVLFGIGSLARTTLGHRALRLVAAIADHLPVLRSVYPRIREATGVISRGEREALRHFVLAEVGEGHWLPGFVTGESRWSSEGTEHRRFVVYLPSNHLISGSVRVLSAERVHFLDMSVDEGISAFLTGGLSLADHIGEAHFLPRPEEHLFAGDAASSGGS